MSNAHHKNKPRRAVEAAATIHDAARLKELARSDGADAIEATMHFEDAEVTDGGYQQKPPRPVTLQRSLMGGSLR